MLSLTPIVACSSTTRNQTSGDDSGGAGETSTAEGSDSSGLTGSTNDGSTTSAGGASTADATSSSTSTDAAGGSSVGGGGSAGDTGGASVGGASVGGASAGGTGGESGSSAGGASAGGTGGESGSSAGGASAGGTGGESGSSGGGASAGGAGGATATTTATTTTSSMTSTTGVSCPGSGPCTSDCPCSTGEAVCTNDDQCADGLVCTSAAVAKLGFEDGAKSCMPAHCDNDELDSGLGETSQDCGGECGCRATYEEIPFEGLGSGVDIVYLLDLSGDGSTLVGGASDNQATPETRPVKVSALDGEVTFLDNFDVYGWAELVSSDGSIVAGTLNCEEPPDCADGFGVPYWWADDDSPARYPFATAAVGMSSSGSVVTYTEYGTDPDRAYRLVMSTGSGTYSEDLANAYGISGNGLVVYGTLVANGNHHGVWYTQTDEVWTPPYPSNWGGGASIAAMSTDGSVFVGEGRVWVDEANVDFFPFVSQDQSFELVDIVDDRLVDVRPSDMSGDGSRFVGAGYNEDTNNRECVFWDEDGGLRTLYQVLTERGLEFPIDVTAIAPDAHISTNGRIIVGSGVTGLLPFWRVELLD